MAAQIESRLGPHPLHALLLAFPVALFPAALLTDITYLNTAEIQWTNFSAWLNVGALLFGGPVLFWAFVNTMRLRRSPVHRRALAYFLVVAAMWILGLVNAFKHSGDGWSSVGTGGLILSLLSALFALAAGWIAFSVRSVGRVA
jgi:uncharacterized membrane protein